MQRDKWAVKLQGSLGTSVCPQVTQRSGLSNCRVNGGQLRDTGELDQSPSYKSPFPQRISEIPCPAPKNKKETCLSTLTLCE
jgi:hypothetical protein